MLAALVVNQVTEDAQTNLSGIRVLARRAAEDGANVLLFPEAAVTGLVTNDDPAHDLPLGQSIPGPVTDDLGALARERSVWLAIGLLERDRRRLYDSAVLLAPDGDIALHYRRIDPHWHGHQADPAVYCQGDEMPTARTPVGTFAFALCGDLFNESVLERVRTVRPDWLLHPMARCFDDGSSDQARWNREEEPEYAAHAARSGATTLTVNYLANRSLDGGSFGGAMVVGPDGAIRARLPLGQAGILLAHLRVPMAQARAQGSTGNDGPRGAVPGAERGQNAE